MTPLKGPALDILMAGATHVIERNKQEAYVYFAPDGTSHMRLDDGERRTGRWQTNADGYTAEWSNGTKGDWQIMQGDGELRYVNRDGSVNMRLIGVLFGDEKNLAS